MSLQGTLKFGHGSTVSSEFKLQDFGKSSTVSNEFVTDPDVLVNNLSFSHIREIMVLNDAFERFFYEAECMKCNWNAVSESDLEQALVDHLQEFMLELGERLCFETRQKRIIVDDKYYFIDFVFYNRLLHCNVIIELKNDEFKHEDLGQLNAYVGYY